MDDGVQSDHPEFSSPGKIVSPFDFGQGDFDPSPVFSQDNHGTACAGVAVADDNGKGVVGIAPNCSLMPLRMSNIVNDQTIRDLFNQARTNGADVISCSWGVDTSAFTLSTAMTNVIGRAAREGRGGRGCVIVFAAGNDNRPVNGTKEGVFYREGFAIHPDVIAVSASNSRDQRSHYSNFGPEIWVSAPSSGAGGRSIMTTDRTGAAGYQVGDYTSTFGGTSSSTPLVAGICALMLSVNPELTSTEVKDILRATADKIDRDNGNYDDDGHSEAYGWGRVDAFEAVHTALRRLMPPTMVSPEPGAVLAGSSVTFAWTANGAAVADWWLYLGRHRGGMEWFNSGSLGADLSVSLRGLPTDGGSVFVRLFYKAGSDWSSADFEYTAATVRDPAITSPAGGSGLSGPVITFAWTANETQVGQWWLYVGTSVGGRDLHDSGSLGDSLFKTVSNLPIDGRQVFVRLWFRIGDAWKFADAAYTAASGKPGIISPMPGSVLSGSTASFGWSANGAPVTEWWLYMGSAAGAKDVLSSGSLGTSLSTTLNSVPTDGTQVFVRLWFKIAGEWKFVDLTYTAAGP